jgi:hypothetical protein
MSSAPIPAQTIDEMFERLSDVMTILDMAALAVYGDPLDAHVREGHLFSWRMYTMVSKMLGEVVERLDAARRAAPA